MRHAHSALDTDLTSQDERMFDLVHSAQEEGWRPEGATIATHTNPFDTQREQVGMISPSERITATTRARRSDAEDLTGGIRNTGHQNDSESSTPLITELRVDWTFEDEAEEEGASVTDLVLSALRLLREDIREVVDSMEPVEPWDEG
jgi:hypothetical protein